MTSRFTALPLSAGESFVLETSFQGRRWAILFDGGQLKGKGPKKNELFQAIGKCCPEIESSIDIAICSHSDRDHSGGFPDFVETWTNEGKEIGEFWLPALWSPAVTLALTNPDYLIARLFNGAGNAIVQSVREPSDATPPAVRTLSSDFVALRPDGQTFRSLDQALYDSALQTLPRRSDNRYVESPSFGDREFDRRTRVAFSLGLDIETFDIVQAGLEDGAMSTMPIAERAAGRLAGVSVIIISGSDKVLYADAGSWGDFFQLRESMARSAIDTAETIRQIATIAVLKEVPIRWFDFASFEGGNGPSGGIQGLLRPLNAVEFGRPHVELDDTRLFFSLKLTEQNVSSLVFQRDENDGEPSAIFLADSRLAFGVDRPVKNFDKHISTVSKPIVFTAAHHGSRNNDRAYEVLRQWLGENIFGQSIAVRNGGIRNQTLASFLTINRRRCAQCFQCRGGDWRQPVEVITSDGRWEWPPVDTERCRMPRP